MGIRTVDRIPVLIDVKIDYDKSVYIGTLMNISESGMVSSEQMPSPMQSQIEISILLNGEEIRVSGKLVREENIRGYYNGIGVEVKSPAELYRFYRQPFNCPLNILPGRCVKNILVIITGN